MQFPLITFFLFVGFFSSIGFAVNLIESKALHQCSDNLDLTATKFNAVFTPHNKSIALAFNGVSRLSENVTAEVILMVYGHTALRKQFNPCDLNLAGLCPMTPGPVRAMDTNMEVPQFITAQIPHIAYTVPDLDVSVRVYINSTDDSKYTCIEAALSNGKTVYQPAVSWAMAVISGIGLVASAISFNSAVKVIFNIISLFAFMQSQAIIGMTSVNMPPIVESWTQNFQWSMGIIHVGFVERFCTWYQRATGGTPSTILSDLSTTSIHVVKKRFYNPLRYGPWLGTPIHERLVRKNDENETPKPDIVVRGIERVAFRAGVEVINIFLTGLVFFVVFVIIVIMVSLLMASYEFIVRSRKPRCQTFKDFKERSKPLAKAIMFRVLVIAYAQICTLSLWELTQRDSAAEIVLAICILLTMTIPIGFGLYKIMLVIRMVRQTAKGNSTYSLESRSNQWEFLCLQYKPRAYFFAVLYFVFLLTRSTFVSLGQSAPVVQTIVLVIVQSIMLIVTAIYRPWIDRRTNTFNISITVVSFANAVFLLFFAGILKQPSLMTGVMGVIFFVYNAIFTVIFLMITIGAAARAIVSKKQCPNNQYQPIQESQSSVALPQNRNPTTEMNSLIGTAENVQGPLYEPTQFGSGNRGRPGMKSPPQYISPYTRNASSSLVDLSVPLLPSDALSRHAYASRQCSPSSFDDRWARQRSVSPLRLAWFHHIPGLCVCWTMHRASMCVHFVCIDFHYVLCGYILF
ncbi:DUF907 domain protein [Aspergillus sclerotialis]|uniref:DUF907 domain protein n=1 Tax=Aspergillus sclerotialis TaxID=2070753 RepID=A0A3A2ZA09_9EURO|nr:DUF907 domain protein [Aspergillus sclerotialis]